MRARKIAYYSKCELLVNQQHNSDADYYKGRNRKGRSKVAKPASSCGEETDKKDAASVFLQIS